MAARHFSFFRYSGVESGDHLSKQASGAIAVVATKITDIDIKRDAANFWPGVDRKMRFGQDNRAGDPCRLTDQIGELVKKTANDS